MVRALHRQAFSAPQTPTLQVRISDRVVADLGDPAGDFNEPDVCVSREHRIAAAQWSTAPGPQLNARFAYGTNQSGGWTSGPLTGFSAFDVSIALADNTPGANKFVIAGISGVTGVIGYRIYDPTASQQFGPWVIAVTATGGEFVDKPWVIRRTQNDFFLFYFRGGTRGYRYLRTAVGTNWLSPDTNSALVPHNVMDASCVDIPGQFCCQPAVGGDGNIWLAYATNEFGPPLAGTIRILVGTEQSPEAPGTCGGALKFEPLRKFNGDEAEVAPRLSQNLPWQAGNVFGGLIAKPVPYLACDPTDPSIAYVFYTDIAEDDPSDLNAYVARFIKVTDPADNNVSRWVTDQRVIHDEHTSPFGVRSDQFQPVGVVDSAGRIHVTYYSNRPNDVAGCDEAPGCDEPGVSGGDGGYSSKFDYWYSLSVDRGLTFTHYNLRTDCTAARPLNLGLQGNGVGNVFSPREYNGIDCYESGDSVRIHVVYTGAVEHCHNTLDDPNHLSLLFGQQILVQPVQNP